MHKLTREDGFTITEMMVSVAVVLVVLERGATTFKNALAINDSASQLADANQNLRAGTNQLVRDLLMAGRFIGTEGIAMPTGPGVTFARPGPAGMEFRHGGRRRRDAAAAEHHDWLINSGRRSTVSQDRHDHDYDGRRVHADCGHSTGQPGIAERGPKGPSAPDGTYVTFAATSQWINGDTVNDTPAIKVGDLVLYVGNNGNAIQTVTSIDTTAHRIYFATGDFFHFNQPNATNEVAGTGRPLATLKRSNTPTPTNVIWPTPVRPRAHFPTGRP